MKKEKLIFIYYVTVLLLTFYGCSTSKYLPVGESLYTGADIDVNSQVSVNKKQIKDELEVAARPKPNKKFLGLRPKLWIYTITSSNPKKKVSYLIHTKLGESPVLLSNVYPDKIGEVMENRLNSLGYFNASVKYKVITKRKKTKIE